MSADYSPGEVSKMLGIPGSTLRRYVAEFGAHLSPNARKLRGRSFSEDDLAIVYKIRELASQGVSLDHIEPQLAEALDHVARQDDEQPPTAALAVVARVSEKLDTFEDVLEKQAAMIADLQARLITLEAEAEQLKKPWYKRLLER